MASSSGKSKQKTFLDANPKFQSFAEANAKPGNWEWDTSQRTKWEKCGKGSRWKRFADKWRNVEDFDQEDPSGTMLDDLYLPASRDKRFMIRNCYVEAEKLVWNLALNFESFQSGVIFTGQPGIGKTLFMWYLLIRLLNMEQMVLFHAGGAVVLFNCDGDVYLASGAINDHLPIPGPNLFIWSLFEITQKEAVPAIMLSSDCFPVQSPSPNPVLYTWRKEHVAHFTVFPLWTLEELENTARQFPKYEALLKYLGNVIHNWKEVSKNLSTVHNPGVVEFFKGIFPKEGPPESLSSILREPRQANEEIFKILLNGLVSRFGPIPRYVFLAMFENFNGAATRYDSALKTSFDELQKVANALSDGDLPADMGAPSHRLISLNNVSSLESMELQVDFVSPVVAEKFSQRLWDQSQLKARSMIKYFLTMPQTRGLAGSMFEPFAHRCITNPNETGTWALRLMSRVKNSNSFVLRDTESSETVFGFPKIKRRLFSFHARDFPHLYENGYYTPTIIKHPLFDSFVVDLPELPQAQCLWLLQMTTSNLYKVSPKGYSVVQDIIERIEQQRGLVQPPPAKKGKGNSEEPHVKAKEKAKEPHVEGKEKAKEPDLDSVPSVKVNYVLVRPVGQEEHKWVLPEGQEHQPNVTVYLLELPIDDVQMSANTRSKPAPKNKMKVSTSAPSRSTRRSARLKKT